MSDVVDVCTIGDWEVVNGSVFSFLYFLISTGCDVSGPAWSLALGRLDTATKSGVFGKFRGNVAGVYIISIWANVCICTSNEDIWQSTSYHPVITWPNMRSERR